MNSFLFYGFILILLVSPISGRSQISNSAADPVSPLALLGNPADTGSYLQINYSSPYGIPSLVNIGLKLNQAVPRGLLMAEAEAIGIPGYYEYFFGLGYGLLVTQGLIFGLNLNAVLDPSFDFRARQFHVGSSFFGTLSISGSLVSCFYLDNWTALWNSQNLLGQKPRFSVCFNSKTRGEVNLISGFTFTKSRKPIIRLGISVFSESRHTIIAGLQSGPAGFWTGYRFSNSRLDFLFTLEAGGVFGIEPCTSFKYSMN